MPNGNTLAAKQTKTKIKQTLSRHFWISTELTEGNNLSVTRSSSKLKRRHLRQNEH